MANVGGRIWFRSANEKNSIVEVGISGLLNGTWRQPWYIARIYYRNQRRVWIEYGDRCGVKLYVTRKSGIQIKRVSIMSCNSNV